MLNCASVFFAIVSVIINGQSVSARNQLRNGDFNRYYLYTRNVAGVELDLGYSHLINYYVPTVVVVHGHLGSADTSLNVDVRRELLTVQDVNVIAVDWSIYASMSYPFAQNAVLSVGEHLAKFLRATQLNPASLHLIGFDLGAHIAGIAARRLGGVARVTGLSPTVNTIKLASTDANYVEVIHTGLDCPNGLREQLGHADFYPNGGGCQPGCPDCDCHHNRSWMYFVASIKDNTFNANCCKNMVEKDINTCRGTFLTMGDNRLSKMACPAGIYRVNTKDQYPF